MPTMVALKDSDDPEITVKYVCSDCAWVYYVQNPKVGSVTTVMSYSQPILCADVMKTESSLRLHVVGHTNSCPSSFDYSVAHADPISTAWAELLGDR